MVRAVAHMSAGLDPPHMASVGMPTAANLCFGTAPAAPKIAVWS